MPPGFNIERIFIDGCPPEKCRPFTEMELHIIKNKLLKYKDIAGKDGKNQAPKAFYVAGLAGSGKTTIIKQVIYQLGLGSIENMVNLDMDELRSNHAEFMAQLQGVRLHDNNHEKRTIFKNLIPWFNEGAEAERALYKTNDSVAKIILREKHDFILPIHW